MRFQTGQVLPIAAGHFLHDIYTAFIAPLLPIIIKKLSLTLTQVGSLNAMLQLGSLLNPLIGYMADKADLRYLVILAPAITATLICNLGLASNYLSLAAIFLMTGVSVAAFHAPAPAMIGHVAGRRIGLGMSLFMAFGEMARTIGPLLAVWAVSTWTLSGLYRMMILGWAATLVLFWRMRKVSAHAQKAADFRLVLPLLRSLFLPLALINLFRNFLLECITTYLPTYMSSQGASLLAAGSALSILELAGVAGALSSGPVSDRLGRKPILLTTTVTPVILMIIFINVQGALVVVLLLALGLTALSTTPVMMAMVQEHLPHHRAVGNGLFMLIAFLTRIVATLGMGMLGDWIGLQQAFFWGALISLLAVPAIFLLPGAPGPETQ